MITCKQDLINTYIENDQGELRDLYLAKCEEFGVCADDINKNSGTIGVLDRCDISMWHNLMERTIESCRKLTLSDLKPRTKVEYEKVTESIFDLKDEFYNGVLYITSNNKHVTVTNHLDLLSGCQNGALYRKVERPVEWWEDAAALVNSIVDGGASCDDADFTMTISANMTRDQWCDFARILLEQEGD